MGIVEKILKGLQKHWKGLLALAIFLLILYYVGKSIKDKIEAAKREKKARELLSDDAGDAKSPTTYAMRYHEAIFSYGVLWNAIIYPDTAEILRITQDLTQDDLNKINAAYGILYDKDLFQDLQKWLSAGDYLEFERVKQSLPKK